VLYFIHRSNEREDSNMPTPAPLAIRYRVGDKVTPDPDGFGVPADTLGRVFTVAKINKVNMRCTADDGGRGINFPPSLLIPATEENVNKAFKPRPFVKREFFHAGEIVTVNRPNRKLDTRQPMVVIKHDGGERVNLARLGGEGGRYWRWPATDLVKRDTAWLAERLIEED
jgi:hypothetical protein